MDLALPDDTKVVLPQELYPLQEKVEEYVQTRILKQFAPAFARKLGVELPHDQLIGVTVEALQSMPPPEVVQTETVDYHLLFRHECLALGCRDMECTLCQFNPVRLCERNFGKKYLVSDALKAKCGASIKVEMVDALGQRVEKDIPGVQYEVYLVDGVIYKEKGGEGRELPEEDLKFCFKLTNHKEEALLQHKSGGAHPSQQRKVLLKIEKGQTLLPDLVVTDSSEALLQGRRPPFRLLVMAVEEATGKMYPGIHCAVSEEFVVATRRVKQANKADIPLVDDHVSKIEHIGRETVKKLTNLRQAATEIGVEISMPDGLTSVTTVGQFRLLVEQADKDIQMRKILQIVLKLSKEKWEEAANHALQAVVPDFRKRVWYPPGHNMGIGLLFNCKYAAVQLKEPVALVQVPGPQGAPVKVVPEDQLDPSSLNILRQLKSQAVAAWWSPRHPGWGVFRDPSETTPKPAQSAITAAGLAAPRMLEAPRTSAFKYSFSTTPGASIPTVPTALPTPQSAPQLELQQTDPTGDVTMDVSQQQAPVAGSDPMDTSNAAADGSHNPWLNSDVFAQAVEAQAHAQAQAQAQAQVQQQPQPQEHQQLDQQQMQQHLEQHKALEAQMEQQKVMEAAAQMEQQQKALEAAAQMEQQQKALEAAQMEQHQKALEAAAQMEQQQQAALEQQKAAIEAQQIAAAAVAAAAAQQQQPQEAQQLLHAPVEQQQAMPVAPEVSLPEAAADVLAEHQQLPMPPAVAPTDAVPTV